MLFHRNFPLGRVLSGLALLALVASACALPIEPPTQPEPATPPASPEPATPAVPPTATASPSPQPVLATPTPWPPAQGAIALLVERLGVAPDQVKLVTSEQVDWPDGCMGVYHPDVMCLQAITPGYLIILEAAGRRYEVHTNRTGSHAVLAPMLQDSSSAAPDQEAFRRAVALELGLPPAQVEFVSIEPATWPDACLGAPEPGEICAQMVTPGYRLVVEAAGEHHTFHADATGDQIRVAPLPAQDSALIEKLRELVATQLGIDTTAVAVTDVQSVVWPDSCLGVQKTRQMCLQVLTPGYRVTLEAGSERFTYHTNATGDNAVLAAQVTIR